MRKSSLAWLWLQTVIILGLLLVAAAFWRDNLGYPNR